MNLESFVFGVVIQVAATEKFHITVFFTSSFNFSVSEIRFLFCCTQYHVVQQLVCSPFSISCYPTLYICLFQAMLTCYHRRSCTAPINEQGRFVCDICGQTFKHVNNVGRHKQAVHEKIRYFCELCDASFGRSYYLQYHIRTRHQPKSNT